MHWEILGIPPGSDERAVKRAYAALAKKYNPEEEPEQWEKLHSSYKAALAEIRGEGGKTEQSDANEVETADQTQPALSAAELQRFMLKDIKALAQEGCTDEARWNMIFATYEFDDMIGRQEFRLKAKDIFFGLRFPEATAKFIAAAFGGGSSAFKVTYPNEMWEVVITDDISAPESRKKTDRSANSYYADMYRYGGEKKSSCLVQALKIVAILGLVFIGLYGLMLLLALSTVFFLN